MGFFCSMVFDLGGVRRIAGANPPYGLERYQAPQAFAYNYDDLNKLLIANSMKSNCTYHLNINFY